MTSKKGSVTEVTSTPVERSWERMQLTFLGDLAAVMQGKPGSQPDGTKAPRT